MKKKIGIIGYGNMGSAIAERLKAKYQIFVFDKDKDKTKNLKAIRVSSSVVELADEAETLILAVKPQDFEELLNEIKEIAKNKLIISIAAGITTHYIEKQLGMVRVVRVMPNLPAKIGKGMACLCKGNFSTEEDLNFAQRLFDKFGQSLIIEEKLIDAATAVSGSGPGYYYNFCPATYDNKKLIDFEKNYFIPSLSGSAQAVGFSKKQADFLAETTAEGSRILFVEVKGAPEKLRKQVTSKGGTTAEALKIFRKAGSRRPDKKVWIKAVKAAAKRAQELSK